MRLPGQADVWEDVMLSTDCTHGLTNAYWPADRSEPVLDQTIGEALREAASRHGSRIALIDGTLEQGRRQWSFNDLLETAERVARSLLTRFTPGERVAIWAPTRPNGFSWNSAPRWPASRSSRSIPPISATKPLTCWASRRPAACLCSPSIAAATSFRSLRACGRIFPICATSFRLAIGKPSSLRLGR